MTPRSVYKQKKVVGMKGGKKPTQRGIKTAMGSPKLRPGGAHAETKSKIGMAKLSRSSKKRKK